MKKTEILLNGWRSAIGKQAVAVMKAYWDSDDNINSTNDRIAFSTWALDGPFNFVYQDPDALVRRRAFNTFALCYIY